MLAATFLLTILRDLTEGIVVGFAPSVPFIHRMSRMTAIATTPFVARDRSDARHARRL